MRIDPADTSRKHCNREPEGHAGTLRAAQGGEMPSWTGTDPVPMGPQARTKKRPFLVEARNMRRERIDIKWHEQIMKSVAHVTGLKRY